MIKFFRKIRQRLLTENKVSQYLLYAFGETLLVVIGILIALSINNWNDKKKNTASEFLYYNRILEDFELDKKLIEQLAEKADERISVSKAILLDLYSGTKDKNYLLNQFLSAIRGDVYVPRNVTYKDLISSGNLKLLNDVSIKNSLIQYYSELENIQYQLTQNRDEKTKNIFEMINSSISFGMQEFDYVNALLGPEVMQILPQDDWIKDKNSESYKKFQLVMLFNIAMADREKQLLSVINSFMETPYQLLLAKCKKNLE